MDKKEIAKIFEEIALLLELQTDNPFKIRAYQNAARSLLNMEDDLEERVAKGMLTELEGIGKDLAEKITLLVKTGRLPYYEKLKKSVPSGLLDMMQVYGLGGKKIKILYEKYKIQSIEALKKACLQGKVSKLPGFGLKTQQNILDSLTNKEAYGKRRLWWEAMNIAEPILEGFKQQKDVRKVEVAGSVRRKLETVGDLDFLVASSHPLPIMKWFTSQKFVERVLSKGDTKSSIRLKNGMQADLRIVPEKQFGFALCYLTGSKEHNIKLRQRARKSGWSLSEWGLEVEPNADKKPFAHLKRTVTEKDIYNALQLDYIPPELRENQGEFEAAQKGKIPRLIEDKDIRGTFHNHTTASDGKSPLQEMVLAAEKLGWDYIGIADHSISSFQAHGLSEERLLEQVALIQKINTSKKFRPHVFAGTECDILPNGSLDFSETVLKKLDYVVVSIHSAFRQDKKTITKRLIRAIEHPYSTMVGHVTGRLLLSREPYAIDLPKVIDACIANGKIMELNANPQRLDMDWRFWHAASEKGLKCCINTDAHSTEHLAFFRAGVSQACKGWLQKKYVFNTLTLKEIQKYFKKH